MAWADICKNRKKTVLVTVASNLTAARYCAEIIQPMVVPFLRQGHVDLAQQDNARQ